MAEVETAAQDILLGHASGSAGEGYGGDRGRLAVAERALRVALGLHGKGGGISAPPLRVLLSKLDIYGWIGNGSEGRFCVRVRIPRNTGPRSP